MIIGADAMWYHSTFTLATDYNPYALARVFQGLGYGSFFVPVNVLAYSQLRPDQNNKASSHKREIAANVFVLHQALSLQRRGVNWNPWSETAS
jgi:hypothetical protein